MSTPAAKRRRIDASQRILLKPFRSPFRTATGSEGCDSQIRNDALDSEPDKTNKSLLIEPLRRPTPLKQNQFGKHSILSQTSHTKSNLDPHVAELLKHQRELERQLREVREASELAEQARKIEADSARRESGGEIDGELLELIQKWKATSRQAAEELFSKVRDRVNRAGGPRVWKDRQRNQQDFWDASAEQSMQQNYDGSKVEAGGTNEFYTENDMLHGPRDAAADISDFGDEGEEDVMLSRLKRVKACI